MRSPPGVWTTYCVRYSGTRRDRASAASAATSSARSLFPVSSRTRIGMSVKSRRKSASYSPRSRMTRAIPRARAASVSGAMPIHSSALAAVGE